MDVRPEDCCASSGRTAAGTAFSAGDAPHAGALRSRERRLFYLLLLAWIVNCFDLGLTLLAHQQNLLVELNPLAAKILPHGTTAVIAYKFGMMFIGTAALWYSRRHWVTEPAVWVYVCLCIGLSLWWHKVLHEAEPNWMMANTAEKVLADPFNQEIGPMIPLPPPEFPLDSAPHDD